MRDQHWSAWIAIVWVIAVSWLTVDAQNPPPALPVNAPTDLFSAGALISTSKPSPVHHIQWDLPRPSGFVGSWSSDWKSLDLLRRSRRPGALLPPAQCLARLKGKGPPGKKALMLCAHSDSVPGGPGAGDDAAGVAVVLETLRASSKPDRRSTATRSCSSTMAKKMASTARGYLLTSILGPRRSASCSISMRGAIPVRRSCLRRVKTTAG